ncbi:hypothetical protein R1sor_026425 [Riccia sorocarpa]|uniref:CCHC-type domain-containing protein n=1 Tax=Riccia sorocarpa TaxID=122646 RepID=A0ABD3GE65_9MARC
MGADEEVTSRNRSKIGGISESGGLNRDVSKPSQPKSAADRQGDNLKRGKNVGQPSEAIGRQRPLQDVSNRSNWSSPQEALSGSGQVAHPPRFKAWSAFQGWRRPNEEGGGLPNGRPSLDKNGEPSVGSDTKVDPKRWVDGETWDMIAAELETMTIAENDDEGDDGATRIFDMDVDKAAVKVGQLRKLAVVLQMLESAPSRERVESWIRDVIITRRRTQVCQIKMMSRREFMLVFNSEEGRAMILDDSPKFLDGKLIRLVPWGDRKLEKFSPALKAVWAELRNVPPFLEDQAESMLRVLGPVVHSTTEKQEDARYAYIGGCILLDMAVALPARIGIRTPWKKTYVQEVTFTRLPDRCYICQDKGHWARNCSKKKNQDQQKPSVVENPHKVHSGQEDARRRRGYLKGVMHNMWRMTSTTDDGAGKDGDSVMGGNWINHQTTSEHDSGDWNLSPEAKLPTPPSKPSDSVDIDQVMQPVAVISSNEAEQGNLNLNGARHTTDIQEKSGGIPLSVLESREIPGENTRLNDDLVTISVGVTEVEMNVAGGTEVCAQAVSDLE